MKTFLVVYLFESIIRSGFHSELITICFPEKSEKINIYDEPLNLFEQHVYTTHVYDIAIGQV